MMEKSLRKLTEFVGRAEQGIDDDEEGLLGPTEEEDWRWDACEPMEE